MSMQEETVETPRINEIFKPMNIEDKESIRDRNNLEWKISEPLEDKEKSK